jgi:YegS/Rv2252/BmrU family lipid kinase
MRVAVIINPVSGPRGSLATGAARREEAERVLAARGVEPAVHLTEHAGHGRELAAAAVAAGVDRVIAWGGDGTVNEVASSLAGTRVALGIVRSGSGNGLANELRVPHAPVDAIVRALTTAPRAIDLGDIGGRIFVNVAGIGFDARIAHRFNALRGRSSGFRTYLNQVLTELRSYGSARYVLTIGDRTIETDAMIIVFANAPQYGNRARVCPAAKYDDGMLDLVVIRSRGALRDLWRARRLFTGSVLRDPAIQHEPVERVVVSAAAPLVYHVDGEPCDGPPTMIVRVLPSALWVCA